MKKEAGQLVSGEFVRVPMFSGSSFDRAEYQGPIFVERNDACGTILINYPRGTYECAPEYAVDALPRPRISPLLAVTAVKRLDVLMACSDALIAAGWPTLAREQFLEHAQQGGPEHLLRTIHDVFDSVETAA
jgi:hypothetical protein